MIHRYGGFNGRIALESSIVDVGYHGKLELMPKVLKRNAVIILGLAALFYWSFMFAKHDPTVRNVIPFGDDPYDSVGSFGVIVGVLAALLSLVRAFRPYRDAPSTSQRVYLIRSQEAVVLTIFMALASDVVAMVRHPSMWVGAASRDRIIVLVGGLAVVSAAVQLLIHASQEKIPEFGTKRWKAAAIATLLAIMVLAAYPEQLIHHTSTHLLTVVAGAIVLFAPMRPLLNALVPYKSDKVQMEKIPARGRFSAAGHRWGIAVLTGALIGACSFLGEIAEDSGAVPMNRLAFVASVFIGLGLAGFLIAYVFLGEPLGLGPR